GGADSTGPTGTPATVVLCDQLFREAIGADCGGPAEDAALSTRLGRPIAATSVIDRFEAAPGRWISVYRPTAGS
ncbi:MAG TPA: hypothetical protein VFP22_02045, partial [Candidatus Limnocylindrales bacterium]|nr:hypothetical protein [Candidatus Limnocylindrales bacterium]